MQTESSCQTFHLHTNTHAHTHEHTHTHTHTHIHKQTQTHANTHTHTHTHTHKHTHMHARTHTCMHACKHTHTHTHTHTHNYHTHMRRGWYIPSPTCYHLVQLELHVVIKSVLETSFNKRQQQTSNSTRVCVLVLGIGID